LPRYVNRDETLFMRVALALAGKALSRGETPVGAVVVKRATIIGAGFNRVEMEHDATAHAEIVALRRAARAQGDWRLKDSTVYVTLEPCVMCAAALLNARVERVIFGAWDIRYGAFGSLFDLAHDPRYNHEIEVKSGVMQKESAELLRHFFSQQRINAVGEPKRLRRDAREAEGG
jgi:tRNA(adenine34) deaminase